MVSPVSSAHNVEATQLAPEVQRQPAAKTEQAQQSVPQDSVTLKSAGDVDHDGDSH